MRDATQRERRRIEFVPRLERRVAMWGLLGLLVGLAIGLVLGIAFAEPGGLGFWMLLVGPAIFLGGVGAFTAGITSLESPPPGHEPSQTDDRSRPSRNRPAIVDEHDHPLPGPPG
jgi:hypothetical protein